MKLNQDNGQASSSNKRLRLLMVGGGHAQLSVLSVLAKNKTDVDAILITPTPYQIYSGMLPGWMAGHYRLEECRIDLRPLAQAAKAQLVFAKVVSIDAEHHRVALSDGMQLEYDVLSLDIGSETNTAWIQTTDARLLPVKPLENFVQQWPNILAAAKQTNEYQLVVVGGGAAGVELAFAAQHAFTIQKCKTNVTLVASEHGLLPGHSDSVKQRCKNLLRRRGIALHQAHAVDTAEGLQLSTGQLLRADSIIAATGARATSWLTHTDLKRDDQGYLLVDAEQRSLSHANVFAAGDVCVRNDVQLARSGVHAVFAGPVLANNLLSELTGQSMQQYRPRKKSLYLLATGPKHAIASWGHFSAQGYWVWCWKNWIDKGFIRKHRVE
jgi:pyridine nucleotide-disulfide oxidoreductase family protein